MPDRYGSKTRMAHLNHSLTDNSAKEFAEELLSELKALQSGFSTHAMSDRTIFLEGKEEMLDDIISYIEIAKPS